MTLCSKLDYLRAVPSERKKISKFSPLLTGLVGQSGVTYLCSNLSGIQKCKENVFYPPQPQLHQMLQNVKQNVKYLYIGFIFVVINIVNVR